VYPYLLQITVATATIYQCNNSCGAFLLAMLMVVGARYSFAECNGNSGSSSQHNRGSKYGFGQGSFQIPSHTVLSAHAHTVEPT
jgi:hypothetical protein